jgi:hypothetical protein
MADNDRLLTLIGDLVASKQHQDRRQLQRSLSGVLRRTNERMRPVQPLELTVGDEFQGGFADVASAALASLLIRLELLNIEQVDSRYGLGYGTVTVFNAERIPVSQDGPAWWSARASIDRAKKLACSPRTAFVRTCFGYWPEDMGASRGEAAAIEAFLMCRDGTVARMNARQRRLLLGLLLDQSQKALAAAEQITQGAVSQNLRRSGAFEIAAAQERLEAVPA